MHTGNQKLEKIWETPLRFGLQNSQKHLKMLVEESALNTKDQDTVKVTFEENWKKTI